MGKKCGIYCIENTINQKKYIGLSRDMERRWYVHRWNLDTNQHENSYLQRAWNKYGANAFMFYVLEECDPLVLGQREKYYIEKHNSHNRMLGYNLTRGGEGSCDREVIDYHTGYVYPSVIIAAQELHRVPNTIKRWCDRRHNYMYYDEWMRLSVAEQEVVKSVDWKQRDHERISESRRACNLSESTRTKLRLSHSGAKNHMSYDIYCPELDEYFWGANDAKNKYGIGASSISRCLNGKLKHAGKHPLTGEQLTWIKVTKE